MVQPQDKPLHIAMHPWFALSHITNFLQLATKLAEKGHKISFFLPPKTQSKVASLNHHPHLITFVPVPVPSVDGLPDGAETTHDVPALARPLLMAAMDLTRDTIDSHLAQLRPDVVFFDFADWLPGLARKHRAKSVRFATTFLFTAAYFLGGHRNAPDGCNPKEEDLMQAPPGYPAQGVRLAAHEARAVVTVLEMEFAGGMSLPERLRVALNECDASAFKTCREMEGPFVEFFAKHSDKPLLLAGPVLPSHSDSRLDEDIDRWLQGFGHGSVVYCALGIRSEWVLQEDQFEELVLGLELTDRPFLAALKPPRSHDTIESALPKEFLDRTKDRGMIHGGWLQQQLILHHPSVGCFVTHCGASSSFEGLLSECQLVMLPQQIDQFINAKVMSSYFKVGVEVEKRDSDGFFTREAVRNAINLVMEEESEVGKVVRANHAKWRGLLSMEGLEDSYITQLVRDLQGLLA